MSLLLSSREIDRDSEVRRLMVIVAVVVAMVGLAFIFWPETGLVAVSWLIAAGALLVGGLLIFVATRLRRLKRRIDNLA